jgi:hypothetical protein
LTLAGEEKILYSLGSQPSDGKDPFFGSLVFDEGHLYGTTGDGRVFTATIPCTSSYGSGMVFKNNSVTFVKLLARGNPSVAEQIGLRGDENLARRRLRPGMLAIGFAPFVGSCTGLSKSNSSPEIIGKERVPLEEEITATLDPFVQDGALVEQTVARAMMFGYLPHTMTA